jgi:hypothetical protein
MKEIDLVKEAYALLIKLAAIDRNPGNYGRLERLEEKAQERLFRRLDKLEDKGERVLKPMGG